jgi:hypothetical protein
MSPFPPKLGRWAQTSVPIQLESADIFSRQTQLQAQVGAAVAVQHSQARLGQQRVLELDSVW